MEDNNCPKPECGRPESTHRIKAGKRLSICGNGHSWDAVEVAAQRRKAEEAKASEHYVRIGVDTERVTRELERFRSPFPFIDP